MRRHMKVHRQPYERNVIKIPEDRDENVSKEELQVFELGHREQKKEDEKQKDNMLKLEKKELNLQAFELGVKHREQKKEDEKQKYNNERHNMMLKIIKVKKTRIDKMIEDIESMIKSCNPEIVN